MLHTMRSEIFGQNISHNQGQFDLSISERIVRDVAKGGIAITINAPPSASAATATTRATLLARCHTVSNCLLLFLCLKVWTLNSCARGRSSRHKSKQIDLPGAFPSE